MVLDVRSYECVMVTEFLRFFFSLQSSAQQHRQVGSYTWIICVKDVTHGDHALMAIKNYCARDVRHAGALIQVVLQVPYLITSQRTLSRA